LDLDGDRVRNAIALGEVSNPLPPIYAVERAARSKRNHAHLTFNIALRPKTTNGELIGDTMAAATVHYADAADRCPTLQVADDAADDIEDE
jgi:hypothetical protein